MLELLIGTTDFTEFLVADSLSITEKQGDCDCEFKLLLSLPHITMPEPTLAVTIKYGKYTKEIIFGGIISSIDYDHLGEQAFLNIRCQSYNCYTDRRTISKQLTEEMTAGAYIRTYVLPLLKEDGITNTITSDIADGINLYETNLGDYYMVSLRQILDDMANASGFTWYISMDKRLYFKKEPYIGRNCASCTVTNNGKYRNVMVEKDMQNYRNKQIVVGGECFDDTATDDNITEDGNVYAVVLNQDEIDRRIILTGGSGVFGNIETDNNIHTIAEATELANKLLAQYGRPVINVSFKTDTLPLNAQNKGMKVGDFFTVDLPNYVINAETFVVDEKITEFEYNQPVYTIRGSLRSDNYRKEDLCEYIKKLKNDKSKVNVVEKIPPNLSLEHISFFRGDIVDGNRNYATLNIGYNQPYSEGITDFYDKNFQELTSINQMERCYSVQEKGILYGANTLFYYLYVPNSSNLAVEAELKNTNGKNTIVLTAKYDYNSETGYVTDYCGIVRVSDSEYSTQYIKNMDIVVKFVQDGGPAYTNDELESYYAKTLTYAYQARRNVGETEFDSFTEVAVANCFTTELFTEMANDMGEEMSYRLASYGTFNNIPAYAFVVSIPPGSNASLTIRFINGRLTITVYRYADENQTQWRYYGYKAENYKKTGSPDELPYSQPVYVWASTTVASTASLSMD